jgi:hypothetical protein
MHQTHLGNVLTRRDSSYIETDAAVVRWIAQAAVNVELFTIPLYMTSLYSIAGMHPITGAGNAFYKGRIWPGAKTSAFPDVDDGQPGRDNKKAFNIVFSVFIQEMLHLQMAANLATAIGVQPCFTQTALQNEMHGWTCYGPDLSVIPMVVDLKDTDKFHDIPVNIGPLDEKTIELFLAIEQPQEDAENDIVRNRDKYFHQIPFDQPPGPDFMFGSIGYMYQCYRDYLTIQYDDGTRLWDHVFDPNGIQNDLFNNFVAGGHPMREFMGFETTIALTDKDIALRQALNMMNAITDQGEGATLKVTLAAKRKWAAKQGLLMAAVEPEYCPSEDALKSDYPSYSDTGAQVPSSDAVARFDNDGRDHFERFGDVREMIRAGTILTWDKAGKSGNWSAADLTTADYDPNDNPHGLPTPEQVAGALNSLFATDSEANYRTMSQAVVGSIKGVTTVLDQYWAGTASFPFPSMAGSGDRMSTAWAVFGATPDLSQGIEPPNTSVVNHACQGLSFNGTPGTNSCAETPIFHTCRGSNLCKGMGGCGFVQSSGGGGSCGASSSLKTPAASGSSCGAPTGGNCSAVRMRAKGGLCGAPTPTPTPPASCGTPTPTPGATTYTAPSDNICGGFGGCAVPISAMQLFPKSGVMDVYQLSAAHGCGKFPAKKIGQLEFKEGDKVEDIAFQAFAKVAQEMGYPAPTQQEPNDLRLAFPPST